MALSIVEQIMVCRNVLNSNTGRFSQGAYLLSIMFNATQLFLKFDDTKFVGLFLH